MIEARIGGRRFEELLGVPEGSFVLFVEDFGFYKDNAVHHARVGGSPQDLLMVRCFFADQNHGRIRIPQDMLEFGCLLGNGQWDRCFSSGKGAPLTGNVV